jgi:DNA-binding CsgD family transcriptional regulator
MLQLVAGDQLDVVEGTARQALTVAGKAGDAVAAAHALADLWMTHGVRRDHAAALDYLDQALLGLGDDPGHQDMRLYVLTIRIFTLQNLDRWTEAELALRQAREFARRIGNPDRATWVSAAVLRYWQGQWDDALAELGSGDTDGDAYLRERWPALLTHGVTALVAGRQDQRALADLHLRQGLALPIQNLTDRENQDFLLAAHALALEQRGETRHAMLKLAAMLPRRDDEMTLTPPVDARPGPARARRGRQGDGARRGPGLPGRGRGGDPPGPGGRRQPAVPRIARARSRPAPGGRGARGPRGQRVTSGWEALTPTEVKVAALVARGDSTSDIAQGMFLSRRTVQTYISRILTKLDARSRVEIVREALRQGVSA